MNNIRLSNTCTTQTNYNHTTNKQKSNIAHTQQNHHDKFEPYIDKQTNLNKPMRQPSQQHETKVIQTQHQHHPQTKTQHNKNRESEK